MMTPPVSLPTSAPLAEVTRVLLGHDLRALPIVDGAGRIVGLLDEHDVSRAYLGLADGARPFAVMAAVDPTQPPR
jgi:CBS domain-containing protein